MILFAGGSVRIWSAQQALRRPKHLSVKERSGHCLGSRTTGIDHIAQIRELVAILENHGVHVGTLKAKRVGYVEDEYQIVAEPFGRYELLKTRLRESSPANSFLLCSSRIFPSSLALSTCS